MSSVPFNSFCSRNGVQPGAIYEYAPLLPPDAVAHIRAGALRQSIRSAPDGAAEAGDPPYTDRPHRLVATYRADGVGATLAVARMVSMPPIRAGARPAPTPVALDAQAMPIYAADRSTAQGRSSPSSKLTGPSASRAIAQGRPKEPATKPRA